MMSIINLIAFHNLIAFKEAVMSYSQEVLALTPEIIDKMKTAIELGRWENGDKLTTEQVESAMQAVMLWEASHKGNKKKEPFVIDYDGTLSTGKGQNIESSTSPTNLPENIIIKNKV